MNGVMEGRRDRGIMVGYSSVKRDRCGHLEDVGAISRKFLVPPPATVPLFWVFLVSGRKQLVVGWKLEEEEEEDVGFNHSSVIRVRLCLIRVLMNQSTVYQILSPSSSLSLTLSYNFIHEKR